MLDLAALSNDPSGELDPKKTMEINYKGRARVEKLSKKMGVKRYVLASSCSIYGFRDGLLDEKSPINPLTTYAKANRNAEIAAKKLSNQKFTTTMLRFATVFSALVKSSSASTTVQQARISSRIFASSSEIFWAEAGITIVIRTRNARGYPSFIIE